MAIPNFPVPPAGWPTSITQLLAQYLRMRELELNERIDALEKRVKQLESK